MKQMFILDDHPAIGVAVSATIRHLVELFHALGGTLVDPEAVSNLVMVYPPGARS